MPIFCPKSKPKLRRKNPPRIRRFLSLFFAASVAGVAQAAPEVFQTGDLVVLQNDKTCLEFDLSKGTYDVYEQSELRAGADGQPSLLCYLDLPNDSTSKNTSGEAIELIQGKDLRRWENHEFRCSEMASSAKGRKQIVIEVSDLKKDQPYTLGFSWW